MATRLFYTTRRTEGYRNSFSFSSFSVLFFSYLSFKVSFHLFLLLVLLFLLLSPPHSHSHHLLNILHFVSHSLFRFTCLGLYQTVLRVVLQTGSVINTVTQHATTLCVTGMVETVPTEQNLVLYMAMDMVGLHHGDPNTTLLLIVTLAVSLHGLVIDTVTTHVVYHSVVMMLVIVEHLDSTHSFMSILVIVTVTIKPFWYL